MTRPENWKLIKKAIEDSEKDWFDCFKRAKGDYKKARELYNDY